jgi:hypothetical protein
MSFKELIAGNVYMIRWDSLDAADQPRFLRSVYAATMGKERLAAVIAVIPEHSHLPSPEFREGGARITRQCLEHADMAIVVFEGDGLLVSAKRTVANAMALVGGFGSKACVDVSIDKALLRVQGRLTEPIITIRDKARTAGIG